MPNNMGLYSLQEFSDKFVAKLAPDAFVTFMGSTGLTIALGTNSNNFNFKSGVASISTSTSAVPGAGTCNISYICPQYTSLNDSYYVTQPDGTKTKFFQTMMEVRVYAKARFLQKPSNNTDLTPVYNPVFWGYIAQISESYSGSETTFSLTCRDVLSWWEYIFDNNIAVPGTQTQFGGGVSPPAGNLYQFMNPWEIILNLFKETSFANFVYPSPLQQGGASVPANNVPNFITNTSEGGGYDLISKSIINDWINRFNLGKVLSPDAQKASGVSNLEMFGISNVIRICDDKQSAFGTISRADYQVNSSNRATNRYGVKNTNTDRTSPQKGESANNIAKDKDLSALGGDTVIRRVSSQNNTDLTVDLNFGMLDGVLPFGDWTQTNGKFTAEPNRFTKLQVASTVAETVQFEFFQDTNGSFVFKPPFYNMDVSRNPIYTIRASDIITFEEAEDSSVIKNYAVATGNIIQEAPMTINAWHIDAGSIRKYGLRETRISLKYGATSNQLRALAAGEMAKNNAKAQTSSLTIPMRTEIRIGYPVYIDHIDAYYYVKGVSHSITFGATATTTLTLEAKRSKVYGADGNVQKGYIFKAFATKQPDGTDSQAVEISNTMVTKQLESSSANQFLGSQKTSTAADTKQPYNTYYSKELTPSDKYYRTMGMITSPDPGFYTPVQLEAFTTVASAKSDAVATAKKSIANGDLTELVLYTDSTTPYTDINGYLHIGSFPYGATMVLKEDMSIKAQQLYDTTGTANDTMNIVPDGASKGTDDFGVSKDAREDYGEEYSPDDETAPEQRKPLFTNSELLNKKGSSTFFAPDATATYSIKPY